MTKKLRGIPWFGQLLGYGLVGIVGTFAHFLVLVISVEAGVFGPISGSSLGFLVGALINHELNRLYVFSGSREQYSQTIIRFMMIAGAGFFVNMGILAILIEYLAAHYFLAQLVATGTVFFCTFVANKIWTFKG